jgi:hypothetical protein
MSPATSREQCQSSAFELIDCVRLIGSPLQKDMAIRLVNFMSRIHRPVVGVLLEFVDPGQRLMQDPPFLSLLRQAQSK